MPRTDQRLQQEIAAVTARVASGYKTDDVSVEAADLLARVAMEKLDAAYRAALAAPRSDTDQREALRDGLFAIDWLMSSRKTIHVGHASWKFSCSWRSDIAERHVLPGLQAVRELVAAALAAPPADAPTPKPSEAAKVAAAQAYCRQRCGEYCCTHPNYDPGKARILFNGDEVVLPCQEEGDRWGRRDLDPAVEAAYAIDFPRPSAALVDVLSERRRQDAKWGEQNHGDLYWLGILIEEVGELAEEIIEAGEPRPELVQVAAVALAWIECMDRRRALADAGGRGDG